MPTRSLPPLMLQELSLLGFASKWVGPCFGTLQQGTFQLYKVSDLVFGISTIDSTCSGFRPKLHKPGCDDLVIRIEFKYGAQNHQNNEHHHHHHQQPQPLVSSETPLSPSSDTSGTRQPSLSEDDSQSQSQPQTPPQHRGKKESYRVFYILCSEISERQLWERKLFLVKRQKEDEDKQHQESGDVDKITSRRSSEDLVYLNETMAEGILLCSSIYQTHDLSNKQQEIDFMERHGWHRRYFRLNRSGFLECSAVSIVACISLHSPNAQIVIDEETETTNELEEEQFYYPITILGEKVQDVPSFPYETHSQSHFFSFFWRKVVFPSSVTIGALNDDDRNQCAEMIRTYIASCSVEDLQQKKEVKPILVVMKGWMMKKNIGKISSSWKRRFVVFLSNNEMVYYKTDVDGSYQGLLKLGPHSCKIRTPSNGQPHSKLLEVRVKKKKHLLFYPCEYSENLVEKWFKAIFETVNMQTAGDLLSESSQQRPSMFAKLKRTGGESGSGSGSGSIFDENESDTKSNQNQPKKEKKGDCGDDSEEDDDDDDENIEDDDDEEEEEEDDADADEREKANRVATMRLKQEFDDDDDDDDDDYDAEDENDHVPSLVEMGDSNVWPIINSNFSLDDDEHDVGDGQRKASPKFTKPFIAPVPFENRSKRSYTVAGPAYHVHKELFSSRSSSSNDMSMESSVDGMDDTLHIPPYQPLHRDHHHHYSHSLGSSPKPFSRTGSARTAATMIRIKSFASSGYLSPTSRRSSFDGSVSTQVMLDETGGKLRSQSGGDLEDLFFSTDRILEAQLQLVQVIERNKWQRLSGNVPIECLSLSPYSAKLIAEQLTTPTPSTIPEN